MKALNYFMLLAFLLSVAVQYNDPDPARWMLMYGAAAVACALFARGLNLWYLFTGVALVALFWMVAIAPAILGKVAIADLFQAWEMKNHDIEIARESGGLLIVIVWMVLLAIASFRRERAAGKS
ncbi:MAG: transmembrane 220 family protein [Blastocatellia bacterium]